MEEGGPSERSIHLGAGAYARLAPNVRLHSGDSTFLASEVRIGFALARFSAWWLFGRKEIYRRLFEFPRRHRAHVIPAGNRDEP